MGSEPQPVSEQSSDDQRIDELRETAEAVGKLAADEEAFRQVVDAFRKQDVERFQLGLDRVGLIERCHLICRWLCSKHCVFICAKLCGPLEEQRELDVEEWRQFALTTARIAQDESLLKQFLDAVDREDVQAFRSLVDQLQLQRFCHQLCHWLCGLRCRRVCKIFCPQRPLITRVGSIPVEQINALGYASGPSIPPGYVGFPNPPAGYGDHPFGGLVWIMGIFNMPTATEYLVEVSSTGPNGSYSPILVGPQVGYDNNPAQPPPPPGPPPPGPPPFLVQRTRGQSGGVDPGWFQINELTDSDGGRLTTGEKTLLMWPTSAPDGVYYLRLRVRDGLMNTRVSSPQVVRLDNTGPFPLPRPTISLQLEKPDKTRVPLKCGKVKKGDGLIVVTIHAYDPNMSQIAVTARGNSNLSVPVVDITSTPLSKTYNGNIADQGYMIPTEFLWDPWNDPNIKPCCYLIYVEIWDRTIINNAFYGGHANTGWEALEIGF
jgi:hypothetical protein